MKKSNLIAIIILGMMFLILITSSLNDSATFDEVAHLGAGYTYLKYADSRLNPEHPPLIKDIAAFPLMFLNLNFDIKQAFWTDENVHDRQWIAGNLLLYGQGNSPDKILFFSRLGVMLLAILFGWLLFRWASSLYGGRVGAFVLFFYAFSPTFLAHSRYVTTDLAAAFGFFIGLATFVRFLEKQNFKRLILAGVSLGVALLLKFSIFLLAPVYGILALLWVFLESREDSWAPERRGKMKSFLKSSGLLFCKLFLAGLIALAVIWAVYLWHVANYPQEQQLKDAVFVLSTFGMRPLAELDFWLIKSGILRPLGQYFLGLLMVIQRAGGGNTAYYLGEVSASGWISYFPMAYLLKETVAFHLLTGLALFLAARKIKNSGEKRMGALLDWLKDNFALTASFFFIAFYWAYSLKSPLNIGIRHVLPTFPFIYLLVSREIVSWFYRPRPEEPQTLFDRLKTLYKNFIEPVPKLVLISFLMLSLAASVIFAFPFYLSYYNELVGIENGWRYIVDSNYDWGQDLKRLKNALEEKNIPGAGEKIYLDYFGGGSPRYYLGSQYEPWWSAKGPPPPGSYYAVSISILEGAWGRPTGDIVIKPEDAYAWLRGLEPLGRGGMSIFIYKLPERINF
ncbi:glycosyltransferase family 39 protein [Candidatus Giovannonibacteria bacterium]|nr:glycosyltransferase family 39 protein [Candidatus Giovannonibacteria bacterium]